MIRRLVAVLVLALAATTSPAVVGSVSAAVPETVAVTIDGLRPETSGATDATGPTAATADTATDAAGSADATDAAGSPVAVRSAPAAADAPFAMLGAELPAGAGLRVRTSADGAAWGPWLPLEPLPAGEGPDHGVETATAGRDALRVPTEPIWVGASRQVQVSVTGASPAEVTLTAIDPLGLTPGAGRVRVAPAAAAAATLDGLDHVSRAEWGADESLRRGAPRYADTVRHAVVHHTAGSNDYTRAEAPAVVRGIYHYHVVTLGWDDIGYNALVDRFGTVYEGRAGGLDRAVIGAHTAGFNTGSFGVSVLGTHTQTEPSAATLSSLADVLAWKLERHGVDPYARVEVGSGADRRTVDAVTGHRDLGSTRCPGDALHDDLDRLRGWTAERMATFRDVATSVHAAAIQRIADAGITSGCRPGHYCPDMEVTRAQMATFLTRTFGLVERAEEGFVDVPADHTHADGIAAVVAAGIAGGYPDGRFRPDEPVTREQMAAMLQRGLDLAPEDGVRYSDTAASPYRQEINALSSAGITGGCAATLYCPLSGVTRAQMASFLDRTRAYAHG